MKKLFLALLIVVVFASCQKEKDEIVKSTINTEEGKKLEMVFNNTKNTATLIFQGDTIQLGGQKPASGIWYKKNGYELRGKGDYVKLTKDGVKIFESNGGQMTFESKE